MATQFIGLRLRATLDGPDRRQLYGIVRDVADQRLILHDVTFLDTGIHLPVYHLHSSQIADLEILPGQISAAPGDTATRQSSFAERPGPHYGLAPPGLSVPARQADSYGIQAATEPPKIRPTSTNVLLGDPAIVSISRDFQKAGISTNASQPIARDVPPSVNERPGVAGLPTSMGAMTIGSSPADHTARASEPVNGSKMQEQPVRTSDTAEREHEERVVTDSAKENIRPGEAYAATNQPGPLLTYANVAASKGQGGPSVRVHKPVANAASAYNAARVGGPGSSSMPADDGADEPWHAQELKRPGSRAKPAGPTGTVKSRANAPSFLRPNKQRSRHAPAADYTDGWATEEATDIQGMGDFDFQENLSKFDKKFVFDQIRADDLTADEDRLVQLNRRPARIGTAGGRNLHHTENVLDDTIDDTVDDTGRWNSEAGETEADTSEAEHASARSLRRTTSRQSIKRLAHRKGSTAVESIGRNMSLSAKNRNPSAIGPSIFTQPSQTRREHPPEAGSSPTRASLRLAKSNRYCPIVNPVLMLEIERLAQTEQGLTEEMMTENAARGIADVAFKALGARDRRWLWSRRNGTPVMAVLAGNNQTGVRAVAGARQLRNHGVRVHLCLLGFVERDVHLTEEMRRQLGIFKESGGRVVSADDFTAYPAIARAPPEVIIDALFGMHLSFGDLGRQDQALAYTLIRWANRSRADVVAVDVPTGIDATTGLPAPADGASLCIRPKYVVSMGAPKTGIFNALASDENSDWKLYVADIGISNVIWRKHGTRRRQGIDFGAAWVAELTYQEGAYQAL